MRTAECVTPRHPDKLCDRISDAILDACLEQDPNSRVAVETMGGHGIITITGEVTTKAYFNAREIAQRIAGEQYGVQVNIVQQSPEISQGVDTGGAGDQGIMTGMACNENEELVPQEYYLARSLCRFVYDKYPTDGKTQVTIGENKKMLTVVCSFQDAGRHELVELVKEWLKLQKVDYEVTIHANPAGDWFVGGFEADTGLTGRKLAVDNYGTRFPVGGGAFSGKDSSKVDRSGAYKARELAVRFLKDENADEVRVVLAYAIGVAEPVMATVEIKKGNTTSFGNIEIDESLTPLGIIESLKLRTPQFEKTAEWGHFGNKFTWDK